MNPELISRLYNFITQGSGEGKKPPTLKEVEEKFLPDVSRYRGNVFLCLSLGFYHGSFQEQGLVDVDTYKRLRASGKEFCLKEINGKHSEVFFTWNQLVQQVYTDPYEIADVARVYGDRNLRITNRLLEQLSDDEEEDEEADDENEEEEEGEENEEGDGEEEEPEQEELGAGSATRPRLETGVVLETGKEKESAGGAV